MSEDAIKSEDRVDIDFTENEFEILIVAIKQYYELIREEQRKLTNRFVSITNDNDEILNIEIEPLQTTIEKNRNLLSVVISTWKKINSIRNALGKQEEI
jgi:hypothetical protein